MERSTKGVQFLEAATNYRLTNFQAALGRRQLPHLDSWIQTRIEVVKLYVSTLQPLIDKGFIRAPSQVVGHSWQTFMVVLDESFDRNYVIHELRKNQIEANLGAQCLSNIGLYKSNANPESVASNLYSHGLARPMFEFMEFANIELVVEVLGKILSKTQ